MGSAPSKEVTQFSLKGFVEKIGIGKVPGQLKKIFGPIGQILGQNYRGGGNCKNMVLIRTS